MTAPNTIGTLRETSLHAALKNWLAAEGDEVEARVGGYWIDLKRPGELVEIQTGNFAALRPKLLRLLPDWRIRIVYPVAAEKWIVRLDAAGKQAARRKSPKRGRVEELFRQMVYLPEAALQPNFSLEIVFTQEEEIWQDDGRGSWRRGHWSVADRRLLKVMRSQFFSTPADYLALLPELLPIEFTTRELAAASRLPQSLAAKMIYCLRRMELLQTAGKRGRAAVYTRQLSF